MASNKEKQKLFTIYISQGLSDREAALKAGYSKANVHANLNIIKANALKNCDIKEIITKELEKGNTSIVNNSNIMKPADIVQWWSDIIRDDNTKLEYKIKVSELLAKCNGMFIQKIEVTNHNYSDIVNSARERLLDSNTIDITPDNDVINIQ